MRQNRHWGRRLAALALTAALTGSAAPALAAGDYWDVDRLDWYYDRWIDNGAEAWYREATAYALDNSLILPFGRSFEGGEVLNRGQFVAILSRLEGIDRDAVEQTGQFTDVTAADYFAPAVYWASASGVVEGPWLQRLMANVNFGDYESRNWFDRMLRQSGLFDRLEEMGIQDGDIVSLYNLEFEYQR